MSLPSTETVTVWARLVRAQTKLLAAVDRDLKSAGLPALAWYDVLLELRRAGSQGLRPLELQDRLLLAQHNVSRLIDRLETAGHVSRRACPEDGRGFVVSLTTSGKALLKRMWPVYAASIQSHVGEKLSRSQTVALAEMLQRLLQA